MFSWIKRLFVGHHRATYRSYKTPNGMYLGWWEADGRAIAFLGTDGSVCGHSTDPQGNQIG